MKLQLSPLTTLSTFALALATTACVGGDIVEDGAGDDEVVAAGDGDDTPETTETGDGDDTTGDGDATMGDGDLFAGNCPVEPCEPTEPETLEVEVYLPLTVSDVFAPSGFMGAENAALGEIDEVEGIVMDETGCVEEDRPAGAVGECFAVTYTPQYLLPCSESELALDPECPGGTWAGVFFQNPSLNWGESAGVVIEPGATKVVFTAWTKDGEQDLNFLVGGIGNPGTAYADRMKVEKSITINATPTQYEIDLSNSTYEMVLGGFGWTVETHSTDPIEFFLDDMRWVAE